MTQQFLVKSCTCTSTYMADVQVEPQQCPSRIIVLDLHASKMKKGKLVDLKDSVFLSPPILKFFFFQSMKISLKLWGGMGWVSIFMISLVP